jgi:hypothetical protein
MKIMKPSPKLMADMKQVGSHHAGRLAEEGRRRRRRADQRLQQEVAALAPLPRPALPRSGAIGAVFVLLICVLMIAQSVLREFGVRTGASTTWSRGSAPPRSFFAMAHAFKHGDFVRVTLLLETLPRARAARARDRVLAIGRVASAYLAFWANTFTYDSWRSTRWRRACCPSRSGSRRPASRSARCCCWSPCSTNWCWCCAAASRATWSRVEERHAQGDFSSDV